MNCFYYGDKAYILCYQDIRQYVTYFCIIDSKPCYILFDERRSLLLILCIKRDFYSVISGHLLLSLCLKDLSELEWNIALM